MYHFIEIKCPKCSHQFVWLKGENNTGPNWYRRKGYDEYLDSAICPKCALEMIVLNNSHVGIDIDDESIEIEPGLRGL